MLKFRCDNCSAPIQVDPSLEGQRVVCINCNTRQTVPPAPPLPPTPPPPFVPRRSLTSPIVTTGNDIAGYQIIAYLGVVRGICIRSTVLRGAKSPAITTSDYVDQSEAARDLAHSRMLDHARRLTANAILAMRYDSTELSPGVTEVVAYGTAVRIAPIPPAVRKAPAR